MLTDASFIRRLDSLYLLARKVLNGSLQADRKSTKKGTGITFADYAEYHLGADYRSIDWRVFARFESLVVKLFERRFTFCWTKAVRWNPNSNTLGNSRPDWDTSL